MGKLNYQFLIFFLFIFLNIHTAKSAFSQITLSEKQLEEYERKAQEDIDKNNKSGAVYYYNKIAIHYISIENYEKAIEYYKKCISINQSIGNISGLSTVYTELGNIYSDLQRYEEAADYLNKSLEIEKKLKDKRKIVSVLFNYSEVLTELKKYKEAFELLKEAESLCLEIGDRNLLKNIFGRLADAAGKLGDKELQLYYYTEHNSLVTKMKNEELSSVQKEKEQKLKEKENIIKSKDLELDVKTDELKDQRRENKEKENQLRLLSQDLEIQNLKIISQEAQIKLQNYINYSLIGGLVLISLLTISIYRGYVEKKKSNIKLSQLNQEITRQKEEIANQNQRLEAKNHELIELNNEKNYIIGIVAHDLKSPLNNFRGLLELLRLKSENLNQEQLSYVELMIKAVDRAKAMVSRILDVSAIESKDLKINIKEVDLGEVIKNVLEDKVESIQTKKLKILTNFKDKKIIAKVDDELFYQVMENLVSNAIKFSPFNKNIYINLIENENTIRTEITDEGPGLSEDDKKKLFKKFQKLSARPTNGESSTGLGLSIVKKYVNAMGGEIECESTLGKGTSFIIKFSKT
jgi:signal transduction histidine kinase